VPRRGKIFKTRAYIYDDYAPGETTARNVDGRVRKKIDNSRKSNLVALCRGENVVRKYQVNNASTKLIGR
jgi:hypothetical protein